MNQTLQPEIDRLINEWNTSKKTLKQEHEETNTVPAYVFFKRSNYYFLSITTYLVFRSICTL